MVLSNAERQRRHRQRIREAARSGVTADDVGRAGFAILARMAQDDPEFRLDAWRATAATKRGRGIWRDLFACTAEWIESIEDGEYGDETDLVRRVLTVAQAFSVPPLEDQGG